MGENRGPNGGQSGSGSEEDDRKYGNQHIPGTGKAAQQCADDAQTEENKAGSFGSPMVRSSAEDALGNNHGRTVYRNEGRNIHAMKPLCAE